MKKFLLSLCSVLFTISAINAETWEKVTSTSGLNFTDEYVITSGTSSIMGYEIGTNTFLPKIELPATNLSNGAIITLPANTAVVKFEGDKLESCNMAIYDEDGTLKGYYNTSAAKKCYIKSKDDATNTSISIDNNGNFVATFSAGTSNYGQLYYNNSSPRFLNYTSGQTAIQIYKKKVDNETCADPKFSVNTGDELFGADNVSITCATADAIIKYTINDSEEVVYDGSITFDEDGTYVIKAHAEKEGVASSNEVTLIISYMLVKPSFIYKPISSIDGLIEGETYVLAYEKDGKPTQIMTSSFNSSYFGKAEISSDNVDKFGEITAIPAGTALLYLNKYGSGEDEGYSISLIIDGVTKYISSTAAKSLSLSDKAPESKDWTITFTEEGVCQIKSSTTSAGQLYYNASSPRFTTYTSAQGDIRLYVRYVPEIREEHDKSIGVEGYDKVEVENVDGQCLKITLKHEAKLYHNEKAEGAIVLRAAKNQPSGVNVRRVLSATESVSLPHDHESINYTDDGKVEITLDHMPEAGSYEMEIPAGFFLVGDNNVSKAQTLSFNVDAEGNGTTGLAEPSTINYQPSTIYDLQGRKVAKAGHGLYIQCGKVVRL